MLKQIAKLIFKTLHFLDNFLYFSFKKKFFFWFKDFFNDISYKSISINKKKINFFIPNSITEWRVDTFYTKEPEILGWVDNFNDHKKIIFWDIGSNIGLYSIYAATKYENIEVISFEPSTSNLRTLSRNISINSLENKIKIFTNPLTNENNIFQHMNESNFAEGMANNNFENKINNQSVMSYKLLGNSINYLLDNNILSFPNYIKIDVDGIEGLILDGADKHLRNNQIKSIFIEINEGNLNEFQKIQKIMNENNFKFLCKNRNDILLASSEFKNFYNYIFVR